MPFQGIWDGKRPPAGLVTIRDRRFVHDKERNCPAQKLENFLLDRYGIRRRKGYVKRNHTALHASCGFFDGENDYANVPSVTSDDLGLIWTEEFRFNVPTFMPVGDATIFGKRTDAANDNHFWLYWDQSTGFITFVMDTAGEAVILTGTTTILAGTAYSYAVRRNGDVIDLIRDGNGAAPEDSVTLVGGSGQVNVINTARWLYGARADNANGDEPDDQFFRFVMSEHRDWTISRSDADLLSFYNVELPKGVIAGLRHYRRARPGPNRRIMRDSPDHIALAGRRDAWMRPCGPTFVDRHYPESCAPWDETNPGIARGDRWRRFDGIGVAAAGQDDAFTPTTGQEDGHNLLLDGIAQWADRVEFISERTGVLECLADWALGAASDNPALRLEKTAADFAQITTRIGGVNRIATGSVALAACTPYAVDIIRRDTDWRAIVYQMNNDTIVDEFAIVVPAGVGDTVNGGPITVGKQRNNSNPFQGAIGNHHFYNKEEGSRAVVRPDIQRGAHALIAVTARRDGNMVLDRGSRRILTPDCSPVDPDIPDGPGAGECVASVRPNDFGHFQGMFDYQSFSASTQDVERTLIAVHDGVIYEGDNRKGVDIAFKGVVRGLSGGRTKLSDWAQHADEVFHFNGFDVNMVRDNLGRWTRNGLVAPTTGPSLVESGTPATNLIALALYRYFYTYYDPVTNTESLPSPATDITLSDPAETVDVSDITVSSDLRPTVVRRLYRVQWDPKYNLPSSKFYRVSTLADNSKTTVDDEDTADTLLVPALAIEQDEFGFYLGGTFPVCRYGEEMWDRMFTGGDPEHPFRLRWSPTGRTQMTPANYFIDLIDEGTGSPITAIIKVYSRLFVGTEKDIWEVTPTGDATLFAVNRVVRGIGISGTWGVGHRHGELWFWNAGQRRIYRWNTGEGPPIPASKAIEPTLEGLNGDAMRYSFGLFYEFLDLMLFTASGGTTDDTLPGDEGIPENDRLIAFDLVRGEWFTMPDVDVNVLEIVEESGTERDRLYAGDYTGFVRMYDENENDGYDQVGFDKKGQIDALIGSTTTSVNLSDEAGNAASLPTTEDGVAGLWFFLLAVDATTGTRSVVDKQRIHYNTATKVVLQAALSRGPNPGDEWCIGGIHAVRLEAEIDFDRNAHLKRLFNLIFFHAKEDGDAQTGEAMCVLKYFQDGATTSVPDAEEIDLTSAAPAANPFKDREIWETAIFHSFEIESFMPDQPCRIDGITARYEALGLTLEAMQP